MILKWRANHFLQFLYRSARIRNRLILSIMCLFNAHSLVIRRFRLLSSLLNRFFFIRFLGSITLRWNSFMPWSQDSRTYNDETKNNISNLTFRWVSRFTLIRSTEVAPRMIPSRTAVDMHFLSYFIFFQNDLVTIMGTRVKYGTMDNCFVEWVALQRPQ